MILIKRNYYNHKKGNYIATDVPQPVNDFKYSDEKDINYANKVIT